MIINKKYKILNKIGEGSFGYIYKGKHVITNEEVAIKIEPIDTKTPTLCRESKILGYLSNINNVPKLRYYGSQDNKNFMVIDLLGKTLLSEVKNMQIYDKNMYAYSSDEDNNDNYVIVKDIIINDSTKKIIQYTLQMLRLIQDIHKTGFVHRDIKPDNFLFGLSNPSSMYIIDFGLATTYINNGVHIENTKNKNMIGTVRYASINIHNGDVYSRRDDIISIIYVSIYLLKGRLPWQGLYNTKELKNTYYELVGNVKKSTTITELCLGLPVEYEEICNYIYNLQFEEEPDYNYIKQLLYKIIDR